MPLLSCGIRSISWLGCTWLWKNNKLPWNPILIPHKKQEPSEGGLVLIGQREAPGWFFFSQPYNKALPVDINLSSPWGLLSSFPSPQVLSTSFSKKISSCILVSVWVLKSLQVGKVLRFMKSWETISITLFRAGISRPLLVSFFVCFWGFL